MRVEILNGLKDKLSIEASRVVIYDTFDNPLAVVVHIEGGQYVAATVANKSFQKILSVLGIDKTVVVDVINPKKLKNL